MGTQRVQDLLAQAGSISEQKGSVEAFCLAIDAAVEPGSATAQQDCALVVEKVLSTEVSQWVCRDALQYLVPALRKLSKDVHEKVAERILELVQPRAANFEEQVTVVREQLSELLEQREQWCRAAEVLSGINVDSHNNRTFDDRYKLQKCLKIATLFLRDGKPQRAENYVNRAAFLLGVCNDDPALVLQHKSCYARVVDHKCKFLEAALRYYEVSNFSAKGRELDPATVLLDGSEVGKLKESALRDAVTCAVLANAGPQRSRVLASLYKDERCVKLEGGVYPILHKVYMERILGPAEVASFSGMLQSHQGGEKVEHAVIEHNLQSASRLYRNISFEELGRMLGVEPVRAEKAAARMIVEGRMGGQIDQVDNFIYFASSGEGSGEVESWDQQIRSLCQDVNRIIDKVM